MKTGSDMKKNQSSFVEAISPNRILSCYKENIKNANFECNENQNQNSCC